MNQTPAHSENTNEPNFTMLQRYPKIPCSKSSISQEVGECTPKRVLLDSNVDPSLENGNLVNPVTDSSAMSDAHNVLSSMGSFDMGIFNYANNYEQLEQSPRYFLWSTDGALNRNQDVQEAYNVLCRNESQYYPCADYIKAQEHLNDKMRVDLVDWLFQFQNDLRLQTETVHLATNIVDRYLQHRQMIPNGMKLLGISALKVASRFYELEVLDANTLVAGVQKQKITVWHLEEMEKVISDVLDGQFKAPTPRKFLRIFSRASGFDHHS